jgi:cyclophilin family peptidyl-prolyl cis-trans isomerase
LPIALESTNGLKNTQYTLAMARTTLPDSATSQFFINLVDNPSLDYKAGTLGPNGYAVFGQVLFSGTAVVNAIGVVATTAVGGMADVPVQDVVIRSMVHLP